MFENAPSLVLIVFILLQLGRLQYRKRRFIQRFVIMSIMSADEIKGKWKQQIGGAKIAWGKLTEDELLKSEGHAQKLAGLVQERYAISREEADTQVQKFLANVKV